LFVKEVSVAGKTVDDLIEEGRALDEDGDTDAALTKYFEALAMRFDNPTVHYNIGLIYKYRGAWKDSFKYNRRAVDLRPEDEASQWNLAIAATALRDWNTARAVWKGRGMKLDGGEGPIEANFGQTPVRLNPDGDAEVVWGQRICPVRARITNIPFPESEVAYGDVVLHDGAPVGYRLDSNGVEKSVFNMLEMFEPGNHSTYVVEAVVESPEQLAILETLCDARQIHIEDWAANTQVLCRACSEGRPHEQHDHENKKPEWKSERRIAVAARDGNEVEAVLEVWTGVVREWSVALER
jgi:tetratricopeptide (TPR) repeat protein